MDVIDPAVFVVLGLVFVSLVIFLWAMTLHRRLANVNVNAKPENGDGETLQLVSGTSAWTRFWDRWEWKPMRLPLIIIALAAIWLLSIVVAGMFDMFGKLITDLNKAPDWWDIAVLFGFFGSIVTWLSMASMGIITIAVHLSQDSPPPDQGSVPADVHKELIKSKAGN